MADDDEKTFYDGQWRTKERPTAPQDPASRIAALSAELQALRVQVESGANIAALVDQVSALDMQLEALSVNVGGNYNSANAAHSFQAAQITALQNAVALLGGTSSQSGPYNAKPLSPHALNDEFDTGSANLADRGYNVVNAVTQQPLSRAGDINPFGATPGANQYFSSIIGSWLFVQGPPGVQIDIWKPIAALTPGDTFFARMAGTYNLATDATGRYNEFGLYAPNGNGLDGNNRVFNTLRDDPGVISGYGNYLVIDAARVNGGGFQGPGGRLALGGNDMRGVHFSSGSTFTIFVMDSNSGQLSSTTVTGAPTALLTRFGMRNLFTAAGSAVPQLWALDFFRVKTGHAWLIP